MKYHEIDLPLNALRRKLMLGLPGGLAMATPLGMLGCGGSDAGSEAAPADTAADVPLGPDTGLASAPVKVTVEWPAGSARPSGTLHLTGGFGNATLANDAADIEILGDGPDLVTLRSEEHTSELQSL